jgi:hypothetical protein
MSAKPPFYWRSAGRRAVLASVALGVALAAPVAALGEPGQRFPATMPALPRVDRPEQKDRSDHDRRSDREKGDKGDKGDRGGDRGERGFGPRREFKITDEEWAEVAAFMKENSRTLWEVYEKLHDKHKIAAKNNIARRYFSLKSLEKRDPALYEIELKRVKVEDSIFEILGQIRKTDQDRDTQKQLKEKLHAKVEELWAVRMEDRDVQLDRIERQLQGFRMREALEALQKERAADAAPERKAEWVQGRYETFLGLGHMGGRPGMGPGGRGRPPERPASRNGEERKDGDGRDRDGKGCKD